MRVEGVTYQRYSVSFTLANGQRRRWSRWAPYPEAMADSVRRELHCRGIDVKPGSDVTIRGTR